MNSIDFAYWLQGYFELTDDDQALSKRQVQIIKNHLNLVFKHEIDDMYKGDKVELQDIHDGKNPAPFNDSMHSPHPNRPNDTLVRC